MSISSYPYATSDFFDAEGTIVAATTCDIGAEDKTKLNVLGSTNITSFGNTASIFRILRFYGTPTITHNGTSMNMPGATNFTPTEGQVVYVSTDSSGNVYLAEDTSGGATVDAASVDAAGAVMNTDTSTAAMQFVIDEDNMSSDSATKVPTQQSVKAYVDTEIAANDWTYATPQATTSGTEFDFTGLDGASEIEISVVQTSLSGSDNQILQLGDAGGFETTGYRGGGGAISGAGSAAASSTAGFPILTNNGANTVDVLIRLSRMSSDGTKWACMLAGDRGSNVTLVSGGTKTLSAALTQLRYTRSGTNTFDSAAGGEIIVRWRS